MTHEIHWDGEVEDLYLRTSGRATLEGLAAMTQEAFDDLRFRPGLNILVDHSDLDWSTMQTTDFRLRIGALLRDANRFGDARMAIVVGQPAAFGVQRMMQTILQVQRPAPAFETGVFYSVEEARTWLARPR